jgi:hypothetical protein
VEHEALEEDASEDVDDVIAADRIGDEARAGLDVRPLLAAEPGDERLDGRQVAEAGRRRHAARPRGHWWTSGV